MNKLSPWRCLWRWFPGRLVRLGLLLPTGPALAPGSNPPVEMSRDAPRQEKRIEYVKVYLTEQEFLDLSRQAEADNRRIGSLLGHIVRRWLYGIVRDESHDRKRIQGPSSAFAGLDEDGPR